MVVVEMYMIWASPKPLRRRLLSFDDLSLFFLIPLIMSFRGTSGAVTFFCLLLSASLDHCLVVDSSAFVPSNSPFQPSSPSSTIAHTLPASITSAQDTLAVPLPPTNSINPGAPVTGTPTEVPAPHEDPFNNIPHVLSSATALVAPSQLTGQAQTAATASTPRGQSPTESPIDEPASSTPQPPSPDPSEAGSQASNGLQVETPSEPQAEKQNGVALNVESPTQPGGQSQSSGGPQVESPNEPQAQVQSNQGNSQAGSSNPSMAGAQVQGNTPGGASSQPSAGMQAQGITPGEPLSQSNAGSQGNINPPGGIPGQSKAEAPSSQPNGIPLAPNVAQTGSPSQSPGAKQAPPVYQGGSSGQLSGDKPNIAGSDLEGTIQPTLANYAGPQFTVGNEVVAPNGASQYIFHDQTLVPGAPAKTIAGNSISLAPFATQVIIGSSTIALQSAQETSLPTLNMQGQIITADSASQYVFDGRTLTAGAPPTVISGITISLPTISSQQRPNQGFLTAASGSYPYSINAAGDIALASQTLIPGGPPITVGNLVISEGSDGSDVAIVSGGSTRTEALSLFISPTSPSSVQGYAISLAEAGNSLNGSTTLASDTAATTSARAASPVTINPLGNIASTTLPMINPTRTKVSAAPKELGNGTKGLIVSIVVVCLGATTM